MTERHPYGPAFDERPDDLSFMTYLALIDIRDETGIDEVSVFDEATLAKAIRAWCSDDTGLSANMLRNIADALDHPDAKVRLKISLPNPGRFVNAALRDEKNDRYSDITRLVWWELNQSGKMEAAIQLVREKTGVSRRTVYQAIKHEADMLRKTLDVFPVRLGEGDWTAEKFAAFTQFRDWLYGFLDEPPADSG